MGVLVEKADGSQQLLPLHVHDVLSADRDLASDILGENASASPSAPLHAASSAVPHAHSVPHPASLETWPLKQPSAVPKASPVPEEPSSAPPPSSIQPAPAAPPPAPDTSHSELKPHDAGARTERPAIPAARPRRSTGKRPNDVCPGLGLPCLGGFPRERRCCADFSKFVSGRRLRGVCYLEIRQPWAHAGFVHMQPVRWCIHMHTLIHSFMHDMYACVCAYTQHARCIRVIEAVLLLSAVCSSGAGAERHRCSSPAPGAPLFRALRLCPRTKPEV